jgi:membrane protease YdiL (CAAX protease family)
METDRIKMSTLLAATGAIVLLEYISRCAVSTALVSPVAATGLARGVGIGVLLAITCRMQGRLDAIGLRYSTAATGLLRGGAWAMGFGVMAVAVLIAGRMAGVDPIGLFPSRLSGRPPAVLLYFIVGAGIAPIAEEIYFRGLIFGYLRRWGPIMAVLGSTLLFVAVHPNLQKIPITQIIGGLLFGVAYEVEKNLMVPIVIHASGNLALFSLPYIIKSLYDFI